MASSTPCWRNALDVFLAGIWMAMLGMAVASGMAAAEGIVVRSAELKLNNDAYELNADIAVSLNKNLEDALKKGLILHFQTEFELSRTRNWWFDESVAEATRNSILSYHLLLRRYYLETNYQLKTYDTLNEALAALGHIEGWQVAEKNLLKPNQTYKGELRLRLDLSQLPKALQINALTGTKWEAEGEWYVWKFEP
ncbi:MAG: DUF4390 domain-containing protein [Thiobacillaceae bacterium]